MLDATDEALNIVRHEGERVALTLMRTDEEALAEYLRWFADGEVSRWTCRSARTITMAEERKWAADRATAPGKHHYNIVDRESGIVVGNCSLRVDGTNAELGIMIGVPSARGQGLGTEAVGLLLRFGFDEIGLHRIELGVMDDNPRAMRCYEKNGFSVCGTRHEACWYGGAWHDVVMMEILRDEWVARQAAAAGAQGGVAADDDGDGDAGLVWA